MAERLAADGHDVTLITPVPVGAEIDAFSRPPLIRRLRRAGVRFAEYRSVTKVQPNRIQVCDNNTGQKDWWEGVDAVVMCWYGTANDQLVAALEAANHWPIRAIGDCLAPRRAIDAVWDGFRAGLEIEELANAHV